MPCEVLGRATNCEECRQRHKSCKRDGVAVTRAEAQPRRVQGRKRKRAEVDSGDVTEARQPRLKRTRARHVVTSESEAVSEASALWVPVPSGCIPYVLVPPRVTTRPESEVSVWGRMEEQWKRMEKRVAELEKMEKRVAELERERDEVKARLDTLVAEWEIGRAHV